MQNYLWSFRNSTKHISGRMIPKVNGERSLLRGKMKFMEILISHNWIKDIISKKQDIKVLEVCGGAGIGGVALSN